jgi:hypothetical protein
MLKTKDLYKQNEFNTEFFTGSTAINCDLLSLHSTCLGLVRGISGGLDPAFEVVISDLRGLNTQVEERWPPISHRY